MAHAATSGSCLVDDGHSTALEQEPHVWGRLRGAAQTNGIDEAPMASSMPSRLFNCCCHEAISMTAGSAVPYIYILSSIAVEPTP